MTVIAWDGEALAADSRITGGFIKDDTQKIFKIGKRYIGIAGTYSAALLAIQWMKDKTKERPRFETAKDNDFEALEIREGRAYYYDENLVEMQVSSPYAIGSGCQYAMCAMWLGHDAKRAVEAAKQFDESCGGKIKVIKIK
jgi:ATP-dependent protease HslVU (ClpYQ) peptidase subunit